MLAAFINPSKGRRKTKRRRTARTRTRRRPCVGTRRAKGRCRTLKDKRARARLRRLASKGPLGGSGGYVISGSRLKGSAKKVNDIFGVVQGNPRRKRNGGRSMAKKKRRTARRGGWTKAKRRRAGKKSWRIRLRRYAKKRSRRRPPMRGYKNNPRRRRNGRRRRNSAGMYAGTYHSNPRRKRNGRKRRNGRRRRNALAIKGMYSNPRRRRNGRRRRNSRGRRRNPFSFGGTLGGVKSALMNPNTYIQLAAAAAGGTVSSFAGAWIASKIASFAPETFETFDPTTKLPSMARRLLDMAATIASSILIGGFVPAKFRTAFILGGGAGAVKPWVDQALAPAMQSAAKAAGMAGIRGVHGISGWISVNQMPQIGMAGARGGVGAWISAQQMARGFRGMNGMRGLGDAYSFEYGTPMGSLPAYDRQPYAGSGVGPEGAFSM